MRNRIIYCYLVLLIITLAGCASSDKFASMRGADEVTQMFLDGSKLPDHTYYYAGTPGNPHALLALDSTYTLTSSFWRRFDYNQQSISKWAVAMRNIYASIPRGAWILDPNGNRIGAWYSSVSRLTIRIAEGNEIRVTAPARPRIRGVNE